MEDTPTKKGWADTEKVGLFLQIIAKTGGKIPWDELELPEGRTLKACQVMVDKEKTKVKKAAAQNGIADGEAGSEAVQNDGKAAAVKNGGSKKRKGTKEADTEVATPKKGRKSPLKKVVKAEPDADADEDDETDVKAESS